MTFNVKKYKDNLLFLPLGGAGEIGLNLNAYHLDGKWLLVDFGAGFAEDFLPGVDMIAPNIDFLIEQKDNILGLVLTHAHEDHLGAIQYLWDEIDAPIYATPFTSSFLKEKLNDYNQHATFDIVNVKPGGTIDLDPFTIELVQLTHSVPEMNAVVIKTRHGNIFHSGDWKLDPNPVVGPASDKEKIKKIAKDGVLAMVCDSTNVFSSGTSGSEGDLRESLVQLVCSAKKMVVVATFASNVARIASIAYAAQQAGRKVVIAGRSLWRIIRSAKMAGYLQDAPEFLDDVEIKKYPREKILVIATGCQGEPLATVNKLVTNSHRNIKLLPEDTILFSSKIIPGNEKRIFRLLNNFIKMGLEVLTEKEHFVHVSGHPNQDDLKEMYDLVKPKIAIPVHGEDMHMHEHVRLAKEWGIEDAVQMENGHVVRLAPGNVEKVGLVDSGIYAIDGNCLVPSDSSIMKIRRRIRNDGIICITIILDKNNEFAADPVIIGPGLIDLEEEDYIIDSLLEEINYTYSDYLYSKKKKYDLDRVEHILRAAVRRVIKIEKGKKPPIEINFTYV